MWMRWFTFSVAVLLVGSGVVSADQLMGELTWKDALIEARSHHPELLSAKAKLDQAKAQKNITGSKRLPSISSNLSATSSHTTNKGESESYNYGLTGKQLLFDGFKVSNDIASSNASVQASAYNYAVVSSNVRLNAWSAFIQLLDAQESLRVAEQIALRRQQNLDLIKLRYEGGGEHKGALMTEQANAAQAQFDIIQAKRKIELSQRRLTKELGREQFIPIIAKGNLVLPSIDTIQPDYEILIKDVPLLKELTAHKEAARFGLKSAQSGFFPEVYANASAGRIDNNWPARQNTWSVGLSVSMPIFQGGLQQAEVSNARASLEQSQADERSGRDGVLFTLANTWTSLQNAADNVKIQQQFLDAARERSLIAEAQYKSGLISFNDWLIIENELVNNQKSFLNVQTNALLALSLWKQAKGETLDEDE